MDYDLLRRRWTFPIGMRQLEITALFMFLPFAAQLLMHVLLIEPLREMVSRAP